MDTVILDNIPAKIDEEKLLKRLRMDRESRHAKDLGRLVREAEEVIKPKAVYRPVYIEEKRDDSILLDGITLRSRVLRVNVEEAHRVFPFAATCGLELQEWARSKGDLLEGFWAHAINEIAVRIAYRFLNEQIVARYNLGRTSRMSPGSLADWPIEEQRGLFQILGDTKTWIGVALLESLMMVPEHSVSGVLFPTEVLFESCQLCPREGCPGRRAPYEEDLYDKKYRKRAG
jgi:hypothetical protein